jgi:hypothetical protein
MTLNMNIHLFLAMAAVVVGAQAHTFHVDAARGDDGRDGLKTARRKLSS